MPIGLTPQELELPKKFKDWRGQQEDVIEQVVLSNKNLYLLDAPTGCHEKGQLILMYDGTTKTVENIIVGDQLMGPDSLPRKVLKLYRGAETMVNIVPVKGERFRVNIHHMLSLKITKGVYKPNFRPNGESQYTEGSHKGSGIYGGLKNGQIIDIPVLEYLEKAKWFKHIAKLYRVPIQFNNYFSRDEFVLPITPYFLGILLGDGGIKGTISITSSFNIPEMYIEADRFHVRVIPNGNKGKAKTWNLTIQRGGNAKNPLRETLKEMNLLGTKADTKFIPQAYKLASVGDRLEMLAGLMDTDGSVSGSGYDYSSKSPQLAKDVAFIARSVGLAAYISPCQKACQTGTIGTYYRVSISGDCSMIPARHRPTLQRKQKKDCLVTGFKVTLSNRNPYDFYGFSLSNDGRYLLDDFTVTHNSGKSLIGIASSLIWRTNWLVTRELMGESVDGKLPKRVIYVTRTKQLQEQLLSDFPNARTIKGRVNFPCLRAPQKFPDFTADDCPGCQEKELCPYLIAKKEALSADIAVLNESYYMAEANGPGQFSGADFVILDEIDSIEGTLMNNISMNISLGTMEDFGVEPPAEWEDWRAWLEWWTNSQRQRQNVAAKAQEKVDNQPSFDEWTDIEIRAGKRAKRLGNFNDNLSNFMRETMSQILLSSGHTELSAVINPDFRPENVKDLIKITISGKETPFVIQEIRDKKGFITRFDLKPVTVRSFAKKRLWGHAERFLGMSGTILSPVVLARELGLQEADYEYRQIPSPFAVVNRPIFFWPVANMRKQNIDAGDALATMLDAVDRIMQRYPNEKGLIHAVSYQVASAVKHDQELRGDDRIITHDSENRIDQLEAFKKSRKPLVMLSPSFDRGVDLPGDQCRFIIVCKIPYLNLGDKQVAARLKAPGGDQWYVFKAIQTLMQMTGRGVRSETDHCDTYILDAQFNGLLARTRQYVPKWWLSAIQRQ